jgi:hypothetical protein
VQPLQRLYKSDLQLAVCYAGVLPLMQESWRQLAADMEQQQLSLQQHPDGTAE